jgi:hypothetical protein
MRDDQAADPSDAGADDEVGAPLPVLATVCC